MNFFLLNLSVIHFGMVDQKAHGKASKRYAVYMHSMNRGKRDRVGSYMGLRNGFNIVRTTDVSWWTDRNTEYVNSGIYIFSPASSNQPGYCPNMKISLCYTPNRIQMKYKNLLTDTILYIQIKSTLETRFQQPKNRILIGK